MTRRLCTSEKVDAVLMFGKFENISLVRKEFVRKYRKPAPSRNALMDLIKRFKQSGSVADCKRSGESKHVIRYL